jgi:hypothetical protein
VTRTMLPNPFTTVRSEGALLPPELPQRIAEGDKELGGLGPTDYHLGEDERLTEAISRAWNRLVGLWASFKPSLEGLDETAMSMLALPVHPDDRPVRFVAARLRVPPVLCQDQQVASRRSEPVMEPGEDGLGARHVNEEATAGPERPVDPSSPFVRCPHRQSSRSSRRS